MFGNTFVIWHIYNGSYNVVQAISSFDKGNSWSNILDISSTGQSSSFGNITMDKTGHVVIVFLNYIGPNTLVYSSNGEWKPFSTSNIYVGIRNKVGKKNVNFFLTRELVHTINWEKVPFAVRYNLYKNANLQKHFATTTDLQHEIRNSRRGDQYYLTWEDSLGEQRDSTKIIVK